MALYNTFLFNEEQFNAFQLAELISLTDATIFISMSILLTESIFPDDLLTRQITNKGLSESIKTADWNSSRRNPPTNEWFD